MNSRSTSRPLRADYFPVSLFHVVVDHDNTATRILEVMNRENSGRVTFMPLNRLRPQHGSLPSGADAIPMVSRLRFDPAYKLAFDQVRVSHNELGCD